MPNHIRQACSAPPTSSPTSHSATADCFRCVARAEFKIQFCIKLYVPELPKRISNVFQFISSAQIMKHPAEERASKRSQEDGEGTSSTGGVSQLDNWSWPAVQGANSNQANKWVQTKCEKNSQKKWIAEKKVKKVPNNFKLRAGLASWLASQASWE